MPIKCTAECDAKGRQGSCRIFVCDGSPGCDMVNAPNCVAVYCPGQCQAKHKNLSNCARVACNGSDGCAFETDKVFAEPPSAVNHPTHYGGDSTYETIKVIEAWNLNYNLGNCVKYISRAGKKEDLIQDLEKARFYLDREINNIKKALNK